MDLSREYSGTTDLCNLASALACSCDTCSWKAREKLAETSAICLLQAALSSPLRAAMWLSHEATWLCRVARQERAHWCASTNDFSITCHKNTNLILALISVIPPVICCLQNWILPPFQCKICVWKCREKLVD